MGRRGWMGVVTTCLGLACGGNARDARYPSLSEADASVALIDVTPFRETYAVVDVATGDDSVNIVTAGHRVTIHGNGTIAPKVADADAGTEILAMRAAGSGWLVLSSDGSVYRARTFTGPLERVADLPNRPQHAETHGRLTVVDEAGKLWLLDEAGVHAAALPGLVLAADFSDAAHGAAALDGGALYRTADGGATWAAVGTGTDAVYAIHARQGQLYISTGSGARRLDPDGSLQQATLPPEPTPPPIPSTLKDAIRRAVFEHDATHADGRTSSAGTTYALDFPSGTMFGNVPPDLVMSGPRGATHRSSRETRPDTLHSLAPWGRGIAGLAQAPADAHATTWRLYRARDGAAFEPYLIGPESEGEVVFSDDGEHAAWPRACAAPPSVTVTSRKATEVAGTFTLSPTTNSTCVVSGPSDRGRSLLLAPPAARLLAMNGEELLYVTANEQLYVLDARGVSRPIEPDASPNPRRKVTSASFGADGTVAATFSRGAAHVEAILRRPDAFTERLVMPAGAAYVSFADDAHGMAIGRNAAEIWRTSDHGAHWENVPSPVDGDPHAVPLEPWVRCAAFGCEVGRHVRVRGWGPFRADKLRPLTSKHVAAPPSVPVVPPMVQMACKRADAPPSPSKVPEGRTETLAANGVFATIFHAGTATAPTWTARWRGHDADGEYEATMASTAVPNGDPATDVLMLRGATRRGLLLGRCGEDGQFRGCSLIYASATAQLHPLPYREASSIFTSSLDEMALIGTMPLPGGDLMVLLSEIEEDDEVQLRIGPTLDRLLRLDATGDIVAQRTFAWQTPHSLIAPESPGDFGMTIVTPNLRALGTFRGAVGLGVVESTTPARSRFYPLERDLHAAPIDAPSLTLGAPVACTGPTPPDAIDLWVPSSQRLSLMVDPGDGIARAGSRALVEASGASGRMCIRQIESAIDSTADSLKDRWNGDGLEIRASGDGFDGTVESAAGKAAVHCTPAVPVNLFGQ